MDKRGSKVVTSEFRSGVQRADARIYKRYIDPILVESFGEAEVKCAEIHGSCTASSVHDPLEYFT